MEATLADMSQQARSNQPKPLPHRDLRLFEMTLVEVPCSFS